MSKYIWGDAIAPLNRSQKSQFDHFLIMAGLRVMAGRFDDGCGWEGWMTVGAACMRPWNNDFTEAVFEEVIMTMK